MLAPTIAATGQEFGAPVGAVGQARTVTATVAIAVSLVLTARVGVIGVRRLLAAGSVLAIGMAGSALLVLRVQDPQA